jgi:hypothetical protein
LLDENLRLSDLEFLDESWSGDRVGRPAISIEFSLGARKGIFDFWTIPLFGRFHDELSVICQCSVDLLEEFGWYLVRDGHTWMDVNNFLAL